MLNQMEVMAIGDRIRRVASIIDVLRGIDLQKVQDLIELANQVSNASTLKEAVGYCVSILRIVSSMTASTVDDSILAFLDKYVDDQLLDLLTTIVESVTGGSFKALSATEYEDKLSEYKAKGVDISLIVQIALQLLPLLTEFFKRRNAPPAQQAN